MADCRRPRSSIASLVREERDYHWTYSDNHWGYDYDSRYKVIESKPVVARAEGPTRIDFPVQWGAYRIEVKDPATGLVIALSLHGGLGLGQPESRPRCAPDKVKLALDKTGYRAGDKLKVTITPPHAGAGHTAGGDRTTCCTPSRSGQGRCRVRYDGHPGMGTS